MVETDHRAQPTHIAVNLREIDVIRIVTYTSPSKIDDVAAAYGSRFDFIDLLSLFRCAI